MESNFHPSILQHLTTMVTSLIPLHFSFTRKNNLRANWTIYIARWWSGWLVFIPRFIFLIKPLTGWILWNNQYHLNMPNPLLIHYYNQTQITLHSRGKGGMVPTQGNFSEHDALHSQQGGRGDVRITRFSIMKFFIRCFTINNKGGKRLRAWDNLIPDFSWTLTQRYWDSTGNAQPSYACMQCHSNKN